MDSWEMKIDYIVSQEWTGEEGAETQFQGKPVRIFSTIQAALDAGGKKIRVRPGVYESLLAPPETGEIEIVGEEE